MLFKFVVALASIACCAKAEGTMLERVIQLNDELNQRNLEEIMSMQPRRNLAITPDDVNYFKSSKYKRKSRQNKMNDLWGQVMKDTSGPREPYWKQFRRTFTQGSPHALCVESDEIKSNRLKMFHT